MAHARGCPGWRPLLVCLRGKKGALGGCGHQIIGREAVRATLAGQKAA